MEKTIREILKQGDFKVNGSLWIENQGTRFSDPVSRAAGAYAETGSIKQAASSKWECLTKSLGPGQ